MKRIFVVGIVLLALLALAGVGSAADTGKADVQGDVNFVHPTINLEVTNNLNSGWTMGPGENINGKIGNSINGIQVVCTWSGYPDGVRVVVADKLDESKPAGTAGKMVAYHVEDKLGTWYPSNILTNQFAINDVLRNIPISGNDQVLASNIPYPFVNNYYVKQFIVPEDANDHYRIILTFTATPN